MYNKKVSIVIRIVRKKYPSACCGEQQWKEGMSQESQQLRYEMVAVQLECRDLGSGETKGLTGELDGEGGGGSGGRGKRSMEDDRSTLP